MRLSTLPWRARRAAVAVFALFAVGIYATPSVNVALKTSFEAAPYLLELLETAALENSTSYFPLLDRIADGTFSELNTEKELYDKFTDVLLKDGHLRDSESLSSFKFALALHAAAPRIEAHFQYYRTSVEPTMMAAQDAACPVWVHFDEKQYCSPALERAQQDVPMQGSDAELPFDRILAGQTEALPSILYADITHPLFGQFHDTISKTAKDGHTSYRLRYRPSSSTSSQPLYVNGYGVELMLKRTDYIVIDDRDEGGAEPGQSQQITGEPPDDQLEDLKPLTTSELANIGLKTASFIMSNSDPFETLLKVSTNFPRYSSTIAPQNVSADFLQEFKGNRGAFLSSGSNVLWINGLQVDHRQINAFSLLEQLKRERKTISQLREIGLTATEAINLISHDTIAEAYADEEPQRYDWRDESEGSNVIMWLNDLELDKRYSAWPSELKALLQRTYPGQLPLVRRDIHNLILPVDLANPEDLGIIVDVLQNFVKRMIPIRIGLIPTLKDATSIEHAKLAYHTLDTYGLGTLMAFLQNVLVNQKSTSIGKSSFSTAVKSGIVRPGREVLTYERIVESENPRFVLQKTEQYLARLQLGGLNSPFLINGVALPRNENWLDLMSQRITFDLRAVQRGVYEDTFPEDTWLPHFFLFRAASQRNTLIVPDEQRSIKVLDVSDLIKQHSDVFSSLPRMPGSNSGLLSERAHLFLVVDLSSLHGLELLEEAVSTHRVHPEIEILILHNPSNLDSTSPISFKLFNAVQKGKLEFSDNEISAVLDDDENLIAQNEELVNAANTFWQSKQVLAESMGMAPGENWLWLNGRVISLTNASFGGQEFETLYNFEMAQRITAVTTAITALDLEEKFASSLDLAKITSLVARSLKSDVPEGIYESAALIRMNKFRVWNGTYSSIHVSNSADPSIRIVASIDPASELAQNWLPILKTLTELEGVDLVIYLNPKERITELPIKRFYRQVISSAPSFDEHGSLITPQASFTGIPAEALLNLGMVVPPSWLVAPEECIYDLDNIKLSSLPAGQNINAIYELEHILIEGHSRDTTKGSVPRGVQLLLGTEQNPHFTDTLIMANLGYFQFKANPGYWHISLKSGRSSKIFNIDSVFAESNQLDLAVKTTSVALMSFQGTTLFPRLSRKPGMEDEEVLETVKAGGAMGIFSKGASFAASALSSVGLSKSTTTNADINIFSVASGHLYERMLNIMMLSVMKNTSHTVKFWFIEQFLSPSFKSFLPHLAEHYGFDFEMVTYKWPHWLRGQREKQREIWGYKILFLDVLFPLSLDKVIFVDADQIVRTDMMELNKVDLKGAPYGFTPMCDDRTEMEGFRFWKTGYWANFLQGKPYHISALYVVDLKKFRELAAGDRLRQQYHALSADPGSLSNLDQDLPNHMQHVLPIHSLSQEWLWCETWCSDQSLAKAKTIDLCNNPLTKEPKLDRARRQVKEWTIYDDEIAEVRKKVRENNVPVVGEKGTGRTKDEL